MDTRLYTIALASLVFLCSSCVKGGEEFSESNRIHLTAATMTSTKGSPSGTSGIVNQTTDVELPLGLVRIDQNSDVSYPAFTETSQPLTGTLGRPDNSSLALREVQFTHAQFYRNATSKVRFASFSPWDPDDPRYIYTSGNSESTATIPIDGETDILYGSVTTGSRDQAFNTIQFSHALCQYNIYVYAMVGKKEKLDDDGNPIVDSNGDIIYEEYDTSDLWGELTGLRIESLPANCNITLPLDEDGTYRISYSDETADVDFAAANNLFFLSNTKLPAGYENKVKVAASVAGPPSDGQLHLAITTAGTSGSITKEVSIARNFRHGYAYDIFLRFSDHGFVNSSVQVSTWETGGVFEMDNNKTKMYHDLSRYGTANTYLIQAGNYGYAFDGTVKGNGSSPDPVIAPGYVDILWSDFDNESFTDSHGNTVKTLDSNGNPTSENEPYVRLVSHKLSEGKRVLVTVGEEAGNAAHVLRKKGNIVIGAFTDDTRTELLWTWNLWITDKVRELGIGNGYTMMDRNLGAVGVATKAEATGLFYQWGRPFPLSSGFNASTKRLSSADKGMTSMEPGYAVTFYGQGEEDWISTPDDGLWGFTDERTDMKKTAWDPCPVGYMVPNEGVWLSLKSREDSFDGNFGVFRVNDNDIKIPVTGYYDRNGAIAETDKSFLWTGYIDNSGNALHYENTAMNTLSAAGSVPRSAAMQVRCISIPKESVVVKNLSASQTANCYIISRDGFYKFDATVRGNGVGDILPLGGTERWQINAGQPVRMNNVHHVDMLWWQGDMVEYDEWANISTPASTQTLAEKGMNIEILDGGRLTDGFCNLKVSSVGGAFHKGNALLAAYDANGTLLWSWHLWLTDTPQNKENGNYALMDRFLGATYVPGNITSTFSLTEEQRWASFGLYYQWGRKDPMFQPAKGSTASNRNCAPYWRKRSDGNWDKVSTQRTAAGAGMVISEITKNPDTFYTATAVRDANSLWFNRQNSGLDTDNQNTALWGYAVKGSNWGRSFTKTMYDPCPPGYRTMLHSAGFGSPVDGDGFNTAATAANDRNRNGYGMVINVAGVSTFAQGYYAPAWYPYAGYRSYDGNTKEVGTYARITTGMPMGDYNIRSTYLYNNNNGSGQSADSNPYGPSVAMSVRCQKD